MADSDGLTVNTGQLGEITEILGIERQEGGLFYVLVRVTSFDGTAVRRLLRCEEDKVVGYCVHDVRPIFTFLTEKMDSGKFPARSVRIDVLHERQRFCLLHFRRLHEGQHLHHHTGRRRRKLAQNSIMSVLFVILSIRSRSFLIVHNWRVVLTEK